MIIDRLLISSNQNQCVLTLDKQIRSYQIKLLISLLQMLKFKNLNIEHEPFLTITIIWTAMNYLLQRSPV